MLTTITIEKFCLQEESNWSDAAWKKQRLAQLEQELDAGRYGVIQKEFEWIGTERVRKLDSLQIACEMIKFHRLRMSGLNLHQAIDEVIGRA